MSLYDFDDPVFEKLDKVSYYREKWGNRWERSKTMFPFAVVFIVGLMTVAIMLNRHAESIWKKVNINTPIYTDSSWLSNKNISADLTYRLVRPINATEINTMDIPEWKKQRLIAELDTSAEFNKPVMIYSALSFQKDSIFKYKTAYIGSCIKKDSVTAMMKTDSLVQLSGKWLGFKPNMKLALIDQDFKLPENYVYADDLYYLKPADINLGGEPSILKKAVKTKL
ncbi:hypothetical protein [uncultured Mucilaginibacter sp.]|uniref:hypothetical protein n=1 Tax=uncultured Mucilaginibacter sp. TaxID=797541 RepID=UPI0025EC5638|nr:hypothetical protein [uncultured Mucilaginibacter sp.]